MTNPGSDRPRPQPAPFFVPSLRKKPVKAEVLEAEPKPKTAEIIVPAKPGSGLDLYLAAETAEKIKEYGEAAYAKTTRINYEADWNRFCEWCLKNSLPFLPSAPAVVAGYISERASAGIKPATVSGDLAAISWAHRREGHISPTLDPMVKAVIKGIRNKHKTKPNKKAPIAPGDFARAVSAFGNSPTGLRNRALLLLGFSGAFRRSELVAVTVEDLDFAKQGVAVFVPISKTDQEGKGDVVTIEYGGKEETCPVLSLKKWLSVSGITNGPVFRAIRNNGALGKKALCDKMVALLVKDLVRAAGLDERVYAGHSLRSGYVTTAINNGVDITTISRHCRHNGIVTTLGYAQLNKDELFKKHPTQKLGL